MTLHAARELSRLSNEHFYVAIQDEGFDAVPGTLVVYECWPGGRCVKYDVRIIGIRAFERYRLRAKKCEKRVQKCAEKYQKHLEILPLSSENG